MTIYYARLWPACLRGPFTLPCLPMSGSCLSLNPIHINYGVDGAFALPCPDLPFKLLVRVTTTIVDSSQSSEPSSMRAASDQRVCDHIFAADFFGTEFYPVDPNYCLGIWWLFVVL